MSERRGPGQLASAIVETLWATAFRCTGRLRPTAAKTWESPGGQRVLVVAPHPDDEVLGCGGTLLLHRQRGDRVAVVCVTDGRGRPGTRAEPETYVRRRRDEAEAAAAVLGVERLEWLGLPEWRWDPMDLPPLLAGHLAAWSPHVLYLPSQVDYHPEHRKVAHAVARTLGPELDPPVRIYQVQVPLTSLLVNLLADTSPVARDVRRAVRAHISQLTTLLAGDRLRRYAAAFHRRELTVEEFWEMPATRYRALHRVAPSRWYPNAYRGLRRIPVTDPLAYLVGRAARRELDGRRRGHAGSSTPHAG